MPTVVSAVQQIELVETQKKLSRCQPPSPQKMTTYLSLGTQHRTVLERRTTQVTVLLSGRAQTSKRFTHNGQARNSQLSRETTNAPTLPATGSSGGSVSPVLFVLGLGGLLMLFARHRTPDRQQF